MKKNLLLLIILLPLFISALTLDEAVNLALENNKDLKMAKDDVKIANRSYKDIKGSLYPQISSQIGVFNQHTNLPDKADVEVPSLVGMMDSTATMNDYTISGFLDDYIRNSLPEMKQDITQYGTSIKLNQVLYLGGKLTAGIEAAKKYENLTNYQYDLKQIEVVYQTKQLFYSSILAKNAYEMNEDALQTARKHLAQVNTMYENEIVSKYDQLRAELEVSKLDPQVVQAKNQYDLALEALAKQIGQSGKEIELEGTIDFAEREIADLDSAIDIAMKNRLELKLTKLSRQMYGLQYKAEKGNFLPNVVFQAEFNHFAEGDDSFSLEGDDFGTSYKYGIGVEIPLFTGFSNKNKKEKAYYEFNKAKIQEKDLQELITLDVRNAYLNLEHAIEALQTQTKNVNLAQKGLSIAETRFQNNIGIQLEVFDAQLQVNIAKLSMLSAKYQALMAYENYQKSIGNYK